MWQRSSFYNKARLDMNAWQLRWFTMSQVEIVSVPDRVTTSDKYKIAYPPFSAFEVDYDHLLFKLNTIGGRRDCESIRLNIVRAVILQFLYSNLNTVPETKHFYFIRFLPMSNKNDSFDFC